MSEPTIINVPPRCEVTGNLCGSDTWPPGSCCPCKACRRWVIARLESERDTARREAEGLRSSVGELLNIVDKGASGAYDTIKRARAALAAATAPSAPLPPAAPALARADLMGWYCTECGRAGRAATKAECQDQHEASVRCDHAITFVSSTPTS